MKNILIKIGLIIIALSQILSLIFKKGNEINIYTFTASFGVALLMLGIIIKKAKEDVDNEENFDNDINNEELIVEKIEEPNEKVVESKNENKMEDNKQHKIEKNTQKITYKLPRISFLEYRTKNNNLINAELNKNRLEDLLKNFKIDCTIVDMHIGPRITQYELLLGKATKIEKLKSIKDDICLLFGTKDVSFLIPIYGKNTIGINVTNLTTSKVLLGEMLRENKTKLIVPLGKDEIGNSKYLNFQKSTSLLMVGTSGSGKTTCINSIIISILMNHRPDEVKLVLVDTKKVELSNYNGVPHLLCPVVNDPKKANIALQKIVAEMNNRYDMFCEKNVKNIQDYNEWVEKENKKQHDMSLKKMPYIIVIIDELADLMLVASEEVEDSIMRITQMARAAGIHLIISTQNINKIFVSETMKEEIATRISFRVTNSIYSQKIIDCSGAEKLKGYGDMYFLESTNEKPIRIQGCYVSEGEIDNVVNYVIEQQNASYDETFSNISVTGSGNGGSKGGEVEECDDPLYNEIVEFAIESGKISTTLLQRRFRFGYSRAVKIVDILEERGIIGPQNGSKPRQVLVKLEKDDK